MRREKSLNVAIGFKPAITVGIGELELFVIHALAVKSLDMSKSDEWGDPSAPFQCCGWRPFISSHRDYPQARCVPMSPAKLRHLITRSERSKMLMPID